MTPAQLWFFRVGTYSVALTFFGVSVYCYLKQVPNPHSIVPKWMVNLLFAGTVTMVSYPLECTIRNPGASTKERRIILVAAPVIGFVLLLFAIVMRENPKVDLTLSGDAFFPIFFFCYSLVRLWVFVKFSRKAGVRP